jgi:hypothetical protein
MDKVPIETLPVELRIHIYELGDVSRITDTFEYPPVFPWAREIQKYHLPWMRTVLMSGILNDKEAIEIAAIQKYASRQVICSYIAYSGNLPMMKWARSDKSPRKDHTDDITEQGMKRIRLTPFPWIADTCRNAAKFGHLKLLKWLHEQRCHWGYDTFEYAAHFGDFEILEWLYQNKCERNGRECYRAAVSGNMDVLKWLRERHFNWDVTAFSAAVSAGNFDMVKWMHEQKCPWRKYIVLSEAAGAGNLAMVKWLHDEQGCPWNAGTYYSAARNGHLDILKWLHEKGYK